MEKSKHPELDQLRAEWDRKNLLLKIYNEFNHNRDCFWNKKFQEMDYEPTEDDYKLLRAILSKIIEKNIEINKQIKEAELQGDEEKVRSLADTKSGSYRAETLIEFLARRTGESPYLIPETWKKVGDIGMGTLLRNSRKQIKRQIHGFDGSNYKDEDLKNDNDDDY